MVSRSLKLMVSILFLIPVSGCSAPPVVTDLSELLQMTPEPRPSVAPALIDLSSPTRSPKRQLSISELKKAAQTLREEEGYIANVEKLEDLIALDWRVAEPLLHQYLSGPQRIATFALAQLYLNEANAAKAEIYRTQLKAVAENRQAPGTARDYALEALLGSEWNGRDSWYVSLFADPTLRDLLDGSYMSNPLTGPVDRDPDRWIPQIVKLVSNPNRNVHDMAVTCLVGFNLKNARRDALVPLLPWLEDRQWSSARDRLRLIQSVADLNIRESIPGLIAVVRDDDSDERAYAAQALAHFKDPSAIPPLRAALQEESDHYHRRLILEGLQGSGGITAAESAAALEALAIESSTPEGVQRIEEYALRSRPERTLDSVISLGLFIRSGPPPSSEAIALSLDRLRQLEKAQPAAARLLEGFLDQWSEPVINRDFMNRLERGKATAAAVSSALRKRVSIRDAFPTELRRLAAGSGTAAGVASALSSDRNSQDRILHGTDVAAQIVLLLCARITRDSLPLESVAPLLKSNDPQLKEAAERYLEVEDSTESRRLVSSMHIGEARILGARPAGDPGHNTFESFDILENQLRDLILARDGPDEILALLSAGYWGDVGQVLVLVRGDKAELHVVSQDHHRKRRELAPGELTNLRLFLETNRVDDLGPYNPEIADGIQLEFVRVSKNGGRRVFMNNPLLGQDSVYGKLSETFLRLAQVSGLSDR